jgi:hypothetical protein
LGEWLRVLPVPTHFYFELPPFVIAVAKALLDSAFNVVHRCLAQGDTIGTHISNLATFVKLLRQQHGTAYTIAQLAAGFLLQGRGNEGRCRRTPGRLYLYIFYFVAGADALLQKFLGVFCFSKPGASALKETGGWPVSGAVKIASTL